MVEHYKSYIQTTNKQIVRRQNVLSNCSAEKESFYVSQEILRANCKRNSFQIKSDKTETNCCSASAALLY